MESTMAATLLLPPTMPSLWQEEQKMRTLLKILGEQLGENMATSESHSETLVQFAR